MIARSLKRWTMRTTTSNGVVASMGNGSRDRSMSTVPLHLSRANNGMVNVLVKSTKVPRPATIVPRKKKEKLTPFILEAPKEDMPDHIGLIERADKALYQSKNSGRNKTTVYAAR